MVSDRGRLIGPRGPLLGNIDRCGYRRLTIGKRSHLVHRLVMAAFAGPADGYEVDHADGNRLNNALSNLRYLTHEENVKSSAQAGRTMRGAAHVSASMSEATARAILAAYRPPQTLGGRAKSPTGLTALAELHGVSKRAVACLVRGETWKHLPR